MFLSLRSLDLFTGIGGFSRALHGVTRPIAMCDLDPDAREVLRCRMLERHPDMPPTAVFDDVRQLKNDDLPLPVDIIVGGWPCQDLSVVGLRRGLGGARSGLVSEVYRLLDETSAKGAFLENVPQLLSNGFLGVLESFVIERGFEVSWCVVPASAVGAPHVRRRLFMWVRKPTFNYEWPEGSLHYTAFNWDRDAEPTRMLPAAESVINHRNKRLQLLGNAVVPDCLRSAFFTLASGFRRSLHPDYTSAVFESPCQSALKPVPLSVFSKKTTAARSAVPKWE